MSEKSNHHLIIINANNDNNNDQNRKLMSNSTLSLPDKILCSNLQSGSWSSWSTSSSQSSIKNLKPTQLLKPCQYHDDLKIDVRANENNNCFYNTKNDSNENVGVKQNKYIEISRNIFHMESLVKLAEEKRKDEQSYFRTKLNKISRYNKLCQCSPSKLIRSYIPILQWLPQYSIASYLGPDIIAGITVSILHIPQGIAYSMLAGLDPVHGLYVSFFPVLIYALLGTSPHISVGTFAIASIMLNNIATKIGAFNQHANKYNDNNLAINNESTIMTTISPVAYSSVNLFDSPTVLEVLTSVCLLCGFIQIIMGLLRLGSLSLILSEQLVSAFSTAISFHVATSQLSSIFGYKNLSLTKSGPFKLIKSWIILSRHFKEVNLYCLIFSIITITILIVSKEFIEPKLKKYSLFPLPIDLILVIASILVSWIFKFNRQFDIQVVKTVPTGLPKPTVPRFDLMPNIFIDSIILSIVCFAVSLSLAKIFAKKHRHVIRPNQELLALGSANVFSSFFLAFPCSAALSRSTIQEKIGGKTQIASLVSSTIILTVLLFLAPFLYHLPKFTLSCIVLVALKSMFLQIFDFKTFWFISKLDGVSWIITFLSVIILDIDYGLIIGIFSAIVVILIKLAFPRISILGHLVSTEIYIEKENYNNLIEYPGVKIFRFCSPLFYLNVDSFKEKVISIFQTETLDFSNESKALILDFGGVSFIDKTGIDVLVEIVKTLQEKQINTCLTNCPYYIIRLLRNAKFSEKVKHSKIICKIYPTIHDAVINLC